MIELEHSTEHNSRTPEQQRDLEIIRDTPDFSVDTYEELVDKHRYYKKSDFPRSPQIVLMWGLVEELEEMLEEGESVDKTEQTKELGDVIFYITSIADKLGFNISTIYPKDDNRTFHDIQAAGESEVNYPNGLQQDDTVKNLIIKIMRLYLLLDKKYPITPKELWDGVEQEPTADRIIRDAISATARYATESGLDMNEAIRTQLAKANTRKRNSHVEGQDFFDSMDRRIRDQYVEGLFERVGMAERRAA